MIYRMKLADSVDEMTFDLLEVPIEDKDIEGATDNTTIDGNIFTDYLWLKKQFVQKWSLMCKDDYTQLRGFYTRQWENAEAPTYTLFAGQNRSETLTASGSAFRIQNGTQYDAPLTLTELKGNATQNGTPTPDAPVAVNTTTGENVVKITGKNLLNLNGFIKGRLDNGALGYESNTTALRVNGDSISFTTNANYRGITTGYIAVEPGGTYSTNIPRTGVYGADIAQYDNAMNFIKQTSLYPEQTYSNTTHYIRIYLFLRSAGSATLDSLQLEKGTATAYEPYQGQSYTINLGNIELAKIGNYQDRIYKDDGKWYVEKQIKKMVYTGASSETWNTGQFGTNSYITVLDSKIPPSSGGNSNYTMSNLFKGVSYDDRTTGGNNIIYTTPDNLYIRNTNIASLTDLRTLLSTNNLVVYYVRATPTTTEITNQALIDQLNFIANLYGGTNNIMLVGTGAQGEIGVEYTLTYEKEQTIIPETTVRLTLTDGGVINTCECRQNVQLTMRETVQ